MHKNHQIGIVALMVAVGIAVWAYNRYSGLVGQLHTWQMPLSEYETYTVAAALLAALLFVIGFRKISYKSTDDFKGKD